MTEVSAKLTIQNLRGLHARAAAKFCRTSEAFDAVAKVSKIIPDQAENYEVVSGKSILGLMSITAEKGSQILVVCTGAQASELLAALTDLVNSRFGEEE